MALEDIAKGMTTPVNEVGEAASLLKRNVELLDEIKKVVGEFSTMFAEAADQAEEAVEQLEASNKTASEQKKLAKKSLKTQTLQEKLLQKAGRMATARATAASTPLGGGSRAGSARVKPPSISPGGGGSDGVEYGHEFAHSVGHALSMTLNKVMVGFMGGASLYQIFTNDMIEQEMMFARGMKQIAYQTQAIAGDAPAMQKAFRETSDVVRTTGFDLTTYQNTLLEASQKGLKNTQSIVRTGLNLGKMMGLTEQESAQIADTFGDWSQNLGMDYLMLADISRGMQDISRQTGLVGKNLLEVNAQVKPYLEQMRNAGNLTSTAAKNMMLLAANAKKLGVSDSMSEVMSGMTSASKLLLSSSDQTKSQLMLAAQYGGVTNELMLGTVMQSKRGLKGLATGMKGLFAQVSGGAELTKDAIQNMSPEQRRNVDIALTSITGKGIEQFRLEMEALDSSSKSYSERIDKINKELGLNATAEEKANAERQKSQILMAGAFEFSSKLAESAKTATSFDDAITKMQKSMSPEAWEDTKVDLSQIAGTFSKELEVGVMTGNKDAMVQAMAMSAAKSLEASGGEDFTGRVEKALKNKDLTKLRTLQEDMNKAQQKLGVDEMTGLDTIDRVALYLKEMNENVRSFTGPALQALLGMVGSLGIMTMMLAASVGNSVFKVEAIKAWWDVAKLGFGKLMGKTVENASTAVAGNVLGQAAGSGLSSISGAMGAQAAATTAARVAANPFVTMTGTMGAQAALTAGGAAAAGTTAAAGGGLAATAGSAAAALWPVALALEAVLGVAGGVIGNLQAGAKAADIFDTSVEDLTLSQYYAAKGAGTLTGALNFMSFGLFNNWLKADGAITKALAKFNQAVPILSVIAMQIDIVAGVIWGIMLAIKNVIMGVLEALWLIVEPIGAVFSAIADVAKSFISIFAPIFGFNDKLAETGSLFTIVSDIIGGVGMAIRWLLRIVGKLIGFLVKVILSPLVLVLKVIAKAFQLIAKVAEPIFSAINSWLMGIWQVLQGIFTFDLSKIGDGLKRMLMALVSGLTAIPGMFLSAMKAVFIDFPIWLAKNILNALMYVIVQLPAMLWNAFYEGLMSLAGNDWIGPIFQPFLDILKPIDEALQTLWVAFSDLFHVFDPIFALFDSFSEAGSKFSWMGVLQKVIYGLSKVIGGFIKVALFPLQILFEGLALVITIITRGVKWLTERLKGAVSFVTGLATAIYDTFKGLWDGLLNAMPWWVKKILGITSETKKKDDEPAKAANNVKVIPQPRDPGGMAGGGRIIQSPIKSHQMGLNDAARAYGGKEYADMNMRRMSTNGNQPIANPQLSIPLAQRGPDAGTDKLEAERARMAALSAPVGGAASTPVPMTPVAQPKSIVDVHEKIQREQAGTVATSKQKVIGDKDLIAIQENQLEYLMLMHGDLEKIVDLLTPDKSSGNTGGQGGASTKSNTKPMNSTNFHKWQFGKMNQNASTNVVTTGV